MNNRRTQNTLAAAVIFLALLTLLFQNKIWDWWQERSLNNDPRPVIAEITTLTNHVKFRLPESLTYYRAHSSMPLHSKDTVSTDINSTAIITFKSGLKVELQPNSLITIEDYNSGKPGSLELTFLRGSVKVLSENKSIKLSGSAISKNQMGDLGDEPKLDLAMLDNPPPKPSPAALLPKVDLDEKKEKKKVVKKKTEEKETLPDSYIASIIRNQRTFLNRCYAQYLRLNPDARGRIDCSLTIEPDGTISTARVIGSTIADPGLQQCVVSTLQRARFKTFRGDPIIVNYPINFE